MYFSSFCLFNKFLFIGRNYASLRNFKIISILFLHFQSDSRPKLSWEQYIHLFKRLVFIELSLEYV